MVGTAEDLAESQPIDDPTNTSTLLMGASGWLGAGIREALGERKHRITVTDRGLFGRLVSAAGTSALKTVVDEDRVGTVVNCIRPAQDAASTETYVAASSRLAEICSSIDIPLLHIGSAAEYGAPLSERVPEDHPCRPLTRYASAKAAASSAVVAHGGLVIRPFNVVGARQPRHTVVGDWVSQLMDQKAADATVKLHVRDANTIRDFVSLNFVAKVVANFVQERPQVSVVNVCSGVPIRFGDMAEGLIRCTRQRGINAELRIGGDSETEIAGSPTIPCVVGDPALLNSLGHRSKTSIRQLASAALS